MEPVNQPQQQNAIGAVNIPARPQEPEYVVILHGDNF